MTKPKLVVAMSAYNEEANIEGVLHDIGKQKILSATLETVLVVSDGSSDATAQKARSLSDKRVRVLDDGLRKGKAARMNEILDMCADVDVMVLLDADVSLPDENFLEELITPILAGADLTSGRMLAVPCHRRFGAMLATTYAFKDELFASFRGGDNVFTCHGAARALSAHMVRVFRFGESVGEDAYSYFACKRLGLRYAFAKKSVCYVGTPCTLSDHQRQSDRFFVAPSMFYDTFGKQTIQTAYRIPPCIFVPVFLRWFFKHPAHMSWYVCVMIFLRFFRNYAKAKENKWESAKSSKNYRASQSSQNSSLS